MNTSVQEALPLEGDQLGNFRARMLRNFHAAVADWDEVCSALGAWEAEHLSRDARSPVWEQHRRWVSDLLSWGRLMHRATQQPEFPDQGLAARVKARIRHLEDKLALWHQEMAP